MKKIEVIILFLLCLYLSSCGVKRNENIEIIESKQVESISQPVEQDEDLLGFISKYNAVSEMSIPMERIEYEYEDGKPKMSMYKDDFGFEVIEDKDYLFVTMCCSDENEATKLFPTFMGSIKAVRPNVEIGEIYDVWNSIHEFEGESNFLEDIDIEYHPSEELDWGTQMLKLNIKIPI